ATRDPAPALTPPDEPDEPDAADAADAAPGLGITPVAEPVPDRTRVPELPPAAATRPAAAPYRLAAEAPAASREAVRVEAEHLDTLLDHAGEISLHHARLERQLAELDEQLREYHESVGRLQRQVRALELETDTRIAAGESAGAGAAGGMGRDPVADFDALELDRYTPLQQIARGLAENTGDLASLHGYMEQTRRETQSLLLQQSRLSAALQQTVLQTRMIAMSHFQARLERVVRQTAQTLGKAAELRCSGLDVELDRRVAEIIVGPVEHLLRNALAHGIEPAAQRRERGKPATGVLTLAVQREGREIVLAVGDDGNGLDLAAIRARAQALGLWDAHAPMDDQALMALILRPHFSTAAEVSQVAGRGVGLDAVDAAVRQLGGSIGVDTAAGAGTRFTLRLPTTLALSRVLLVRLGEERLALPLRSIGDVQALTAEQSEAYLRGKLPSLAHGSRHYALRDLAALTDSPQRPTPRRQIGLPVVLVETAGRPFGLVVDQVLGSQEVVVKALGPQAGALPGLIGATVLDDGEAVLIADPASLLARSEAVAAPGASAPAAQARPQILVVDDSLTVRRVT
ncbi:MAG TPA: chemotaxis protein CheW, partial [Gammaproteobacteria bacterium]|nr:chemotaxis protein CheW [Gammaproteobacteria bacterium]